MATFNPVEIFAHRGNAGEAPENTLSAFRSALQVGADGVELDVHATRDGELVVIHDEWVDRTTDGAGAVNKLTLGELKCLDAGGWFNPSFAGESIPTLAEVLDLVGPSPLRINLELKTNLLPYPGLATAVLALVREKGLGNRVIISSFNHLTLAEAMTLEPGLEYAALLDAHLIRPWEYAVAHGFRAIHPFHTACTEELVAQSHASGVAVRPYTVDNRATARQLLAMGVDGLFTNFPARLLPLKEHSAVLTH